MLSLRAQNPSTFLSPDRWSCARGGCWRVQRPLRPDVVHDPFPKAFVVFFRFRQRILFKVAVVLVEVPHLRKLLLVVLSVLVVRHRVGLPDPSDAVVQQHRHQQKKGTADEGVLRRCEAKG